MNIAILLSGGTGTRIGGDIPKQYIEVAGKPIISYSLEAIADSKCIDGIIIVAAEEWQEFISERIQLVESVKQKFLAFALPGENRQLSILSGLEKIPTLLADFGKADDYVFIHDAARPCISPELVDSYLVACHGHDGLLPVLPMKDTVYLCDDGKSVSSLLDRSKIFAGQAPEVFVYNKYLSANRALSETGKILKINGSTEPAIMAGMDVVTVPGDEGNFKITTKSDLERFEELMR